MPPEALKSFRQALEALRRALAQPKDEYLRDSVIQRFEFTYELGWKSLKRYLEEDEGTENVDILSRRDLFRLAAEKGLLDDPLEWFGYHQARNDTVHTYQVAKAEEVYATAARFQVAAGILLERLEARLP
jgi:nucleotidyltransferase substrate binding protein (TIGR01987 family)